MSSFVFTSLSGYEGCLNEARFGQHIPLRGLPKNTV